MTNETKHDNDLFHVKPAAKMIGIHEQTLYRWMRMNPPWIKFQIERGKRMIPRFEINRLRKPKWNG